MKWNLTIEGDSPSELLSLLNGAASIENPVAPMPDPRMAKAPEAAKPVATKVEETKAEAAKAPEPKKADAPKPEDTKAPVEKASRDMCVKMYNKRKEDGMTGAVCKELALKCGAPDNDPRLSTVPEDKLNDMYDALTKWAK